MPVRIYDIAKKLGIESKEVLAKAKELGITGAKVPSSSLDKITAEYLEQQLGGGKAVAVAEPMPAAAVPVPHSAETLHGFTVPTDVPAASATTSVPRSRSHTVSTVPRLRSVVRGTWCRR